MTEKMLKFVNIGQQTPPKSLPIMKEDFKEVYDEFINNKAKEQSVDAHNVASLLPGSLSFI